MHSSQVFRTMSPFFNISNNLFFLPGWKKTKTNPGNSVVCIPCASELHSNSIQLCFSGICYNQNVSRCFTENCQASKNGRANLGLSRFFSFLLQILYVSRNLLLCELDSSSLLDSEFLLNFFLVNDSKKSPGLVYPVITASLFLLHFSDDQT